MSEQLTPDLIRSKLKGAGKKELHELILTLDALERRLNLSGPQTDDELHQWIVDTFDINIPRVAVCEGHQSPFDFLADLFFTRTTSALAMASRGGSKTFLVALLHRLNGEFKAGVEALTVGATMPQSQRCFAHLDKLISIRGENNIRSKMKTEVVWNNGTKAEIVPGSFAAVNGPHPHIMHVDEAEIMDALVFDESRNCAQSGKVKGKLIPAQDIITSTRKYSVGKMQAMVDEVHEAKLKGNKPLYDLYTWCIFEVARPNKGCKVADPENGTCECANIVKGEWYDGSDRTLMDVCNGKFARSDGWIEWEDIVNLFSKNSREVWEAQQECSRPETTGLVLPHFSVERNGILNYQPDPANGPIYQGIDFGSTNPNAVLWWQVLKVDVEATSINGNKIVLKEGSRVCFDEFYQAEIPNTVLASNIVRRERLWREHFPGFQVKGRFADPQGAQARRDLANNDPPIRTTWHTSRDVRDQIKIVKELIEDKKFYIDTQRVPMLVDELGYWHYPKMKAQMVDDPEIPVDDFDHSCSAMRYALCNVKVLEDDGRERKAPRSFGRKQETATRLNTLRRGLGGSTRLPNTEKWRLGLGGPFSSDTRGRP